MDKPRNQIPHFSLRFISQQLVNSQIVNEAAPCMDVSLDMGENNVGNFQPSRFDRFHTNRQMAYDNTHPQLVVTYTLLLAELKSM